MIDGLMEETVALDILQIADVLAQEGVLALGETNRVLEFASHGQHRRLLVLQENRHWNKTARTSQLPGGTAHDSHDGIVTAQQDVAVVHEKIIGKPVQAMDGLLIINCDWLLAEIATGHHQGFEPASRRAANNAVACRARKFPSSG